MRSKLLLIKRDKIGDMILTTPLIRHLREALPTWDIHVLANDYNAWVLHGNPHITTTWVFPRLRHNGKLRFGAVWTYLNTIYQLRRLQFDSVIVGNGSPSHRAIKLAKWIGGKSTVAYINEKNHDTFISHPLPVPSSGHESLRLLALSQALVSTNLPLSTAQLRPEFSPHPTSLEGAQQWLRDNGLKPKKFLLLGLGARRQHRQPDAQQVLRWTKSVFDHHGTPTVLVWSPGRRDNPLYPGDDELAEEILRAGHDYILPCQNGLNTVVGLAWLAKTSIFPDSGLMHIASACPGGVIGLFADTQNSSSPEIWGPIGQRQAVLVAPNAVSELADELVLRTIAQQLVIAAMPL